VPIYAKPYKAEPNWQTIDQGHNVIKQHLPKDDRKLRYDSGDGPLEGRIVVDPQSRREYCRQYVDPEMVRKQKNLQKQDLNNMQSVHPAEKHPYVYNSVKIPDPQVQKIPSSKEIQSSDNQAF